MGEPLLGSLGRRLALAFGGAAVLAIGILAVLTIDATRREVDALAERNQRATAGSVATALGRAYETAGGWPDADLRIAYSIALAGGALLEVRDVQDDPVRRPLTGIADSIARERAAASGDASLGSPRDEPVRAGGVRVGTASLRFLGGALPASERRVRDALLRTILIGAAAAALLSLLVASVLSRRITRPLVRLQDAATALERGDRTARTGLERRGDEIGSLAQAFDRMAGAVAREDELRRRLTADIAHELRTPLAILQASCEDLLDGEREPSEAEMRSLHEEILRLGRIVGDLETLAASDAASLSLHTAPVDLAQVAADVAALFAPRFADAGVSLDTRLAPARVDGDATRLRQVATNLLANSLKYTPAGGRARVEVGRDGDRALLEVSNTGPGIAPEHLDKVFDRFWRGPHTSAIPGSGIGLAVVAALVDAHHGSVHVDSRPGQLTTVRVTLPARPAA